MCGLALVHLESVYGVTPLFLVTVDVTRYVFKGNATWKHLKYM